MNELLANPVARFIWWTRHMRDQWLPRDWSYWSGMDSARGMRGSKGPKGTHAT